MAFLSDVGSRNGPSYFFMENNHLPSVDVGARRGMDYKGVRTVLLGA